MNDLQLPVWHVTFEQVCRRGEKTLEWGLPEQWAHAELFSALKDASRETGWVPFSTELPYLTYYPVSLPNSKHRNWKTDGAIKWADLCLKNEAQNSWCWFELKVRHAGYDGRETIGASSALDAVVKDFVALCGLDPENTASIWTDPDQLTKAYWFAEILAPHAAGLPYANHFFTSAYLQLDGELDSNILSENSVRERISSWLQWRSKESVYECDLPEIAVTFKSGLSGGHSLLVCESRTPGGTKR